MSYPYPELRDYAIEEGGIRQRVNPRLRDQIIEWIVADWPVGAREDQYPEILMMSVARRLKAQKYGSVLLTFILYVVASQLIQIAIEWVLERLANRELMIQYHAKASGNI
jgi:hypothetical protein